MNWRHFKKKGGSWKNSADLVRKGVKNLEAVSAKLRAEVEAYRKEQEKTQVHPPQGL